SSGNLSIKSSSSKKSFNGSILSAATQLLFNSSPPCTWKVDGGSSPCILVASTAIAFVPAPPATPPFSISISDFSSSNKSIHSSNPSSSPAPVHQPKISTSPSSPPVPSFPSASASSLFDPQAEISSIKVKTANIPNNFFKSTPPPQY